MAMHEPPHEPLWKGPKNMRLASNDMAMHKPPHEPYLSLVNTQIFC